MNIARDGIVKTIDQKLVTISDAVVDFQTMRPVRIAVNETRLITKRTNSICEITAAVIFSL
jgi:hypothetical protein